MTEYPFIALQPNILDEPEMLERASSFYTELNLRRSVREYSDKSLPAGLLDKIILAAGTAPSGANKQPWTFCIVTNAEMKKQIRMAAETEEQESYNQRMSEEWLRDLAPLGTNDQKPFLEVAPALIVVFRRIFELEEDGHKHNNYYVQESVGIACGMLIAAIHHAGLVCLTHTPSPMNFLEKILGRPSNERAYLLIPVGYPAAEVRVPDIHRKTLEEICVRYE